MTKTERIKEFIFGRKEYREENVSSFANEQRTQSGLSKRKMRKLACLSLIIFLIIGCYAAKMTFHPQTQALLSHDEHLETSRELLGDAEHEDYDIEYFNKFGRQDEAPYDSDYMYFVKSGHRMIPITKEQRRFRPFYVSAETKEGVESQVIIAHNVISPQECQTIIQALEKKKEAWLAEEGRPGGLDIDRVIMSLPTLEQSQDPDWNAITRIITQPIEELIRQIWTTEEYLLSPNWQANKYTSGHHVDWHTDKKRVKNKFRIGIYLTKHEGGQFHFATKMEQGGLQWRYASLEGCIQPGTVVIFDGQHVLHRSTEVTGGEKINLFSHIDTK